MEGEPRGWSEMTRDQQQLVLRIQDSVEFGAWDVDLKQALQKADAPKADKAAVARFLGGPGADREFLEG